MKLFSRRLVFSLVVGAAAATLGVRPAVAEAPPPTKAKAWIVVDANSGRVLGQMNSEQRRPVASTQKLLTALLVCEAGDITEEITVDRSDTLVAPTKLGIRAGEKYRRVDLLKALLVKSGNDVAHCLGRDNAGSEAAFAEKMTARAKRLGMQSSQFKNASGLPDDAQYSTARDMAKLALFIHRHPDENVRRVLIGITRMPQMTFRFATGRTITLTNTNRLLTRVPGCNGMKTGYTNAGGRCLVSSVTRDGRTILVVVLGSDSKSIWGTSQRLLEWGLRKK